MYLLASSYLSLILTTQQFLKSSYTFYLASVKHVIVASHDDLLQFLRSLMLYLPICDCISRPAQKDLIAFERKPSEQAASLCITCQYLDLPRHEVRSHHIRRRCESPQVK